MQSAFEQHSECGKHSVLAIGLYIRNTAEANDTERLKIKE